MSYVMEDRETVFRIADILTEFDVPVWLDRKSLQPGVRWQDAIRRAIAEGDYFVACFSEAYVERKKSFMNDELSVAIEQIRLRPADHLWFIPVKLTPCDIPDRTVGPGETLRSFQWIELYEDWNAGIQKMLSVIQPGSEHISKLIAELDNRSARKRIEAITALGRLGPLAARAIPDLLQRISVEAELRHGLLPLAAIEDTLRALGYRDSTLHDTIDAIFLARGVDRTITQDDEQLFI